MSGAGKVDAALSRAIIRGAHVVYGAVAGAGVVVAAMAGTVWYLQLENGGCGRCSYVGFSICANTSPSVSAARHMESWTKNLTGTYSTDALQKLCCYEACCGAFVDHAMYGPSLSCNAHVGSLSRVLLRII